MISYKHLNIVANLDIKINDNAISRVKNIEFL